MRLFYAFNPILRDPIRGTSFTAAVDSAIAPDPVDDKGSTFDLMRLPNELILHIIEDAISHEDIENLALCSRTMFELAKPARARHLEMKSKHSRFKVGSLPPRRVHPGLYSICLVRALIESDGFRKYCATVRFDFVRDMGPPPEWALEAVGKTREVVQEFESRRSILDADPWLKDFCSSKWIHLLQLGNMQLAYSLALTTVHNIQVLELLGCSEAVHSLYLITQIVRSYQHQHGTASKPLHRLR